MNITKLLLSGFSFGIGTAVGLFIVWAVASSALGIYDWIKLRLRRK